MRVLVTAGAAGEEVPLVEEEPLVVPQHEDHWQRGRLHQR